MLVFWGGRRQVSCVLALICAVCLLTLAGCGDGDNKPKLYSVKGKVTVAGKPLTDCTIMFGSADEKARGYNGKLDANGEYELSDPQDGKKGAAVGKYKVTLQVAPEVAFKAMQAPAGGAEGTGSPVAATSFPKEYSAGETTPKVVEVKAESQTINIEIP